MRMTAGALLLVAASVFFGAGILGMAVRQDRAGFDPGGFGYFVAAVLGLLGLVLLAAGLATDAPRAQGEIQPTPRWVWITLRVCLLAVLAFVAISAIVYFMRGGLRQVEGPAERTATLDRGG
jgi:drug/metabolite transporter (DMT)-like permease